MQTALYIQLGSTMIGDGHDLDSLVRSLEDDGKGQFRRIPGDNNKLVIARPLDDNDRAGIVKIMTAYPTPWIVELYVLENVTWMPNVERIEIGVDLELGSGLVQRHQGTLKGNVVFTHATSVPTSSTNVRADILAMKNMGADTIEVHDIGYRFFDTFALIADVVGSIVLPKNFKRAIEIAEPKVRPNMHIYIQLDPWETSDDEGVELMEWLEERNGPFRPVIRPSRYGTDFSAEF